MTAPTKPSCEDYIVATIRDRRKKASSRHPTRNNALSMKGIWNYANHYYSEQQFRKALNKLLKDKTLLGICMVREGTYSGMEVIPEIPKAFQLNHEKFYYSAEGEITSSEGSVGGHTVRGTSKTIWSLQFYVVEDGLSTKQQNLLNKLSTKTDADRIMRDLQK